MYPALPDALADALGRVIAEQRKTFEREIELLSARSSAIIADLEAKVARLEVANEMLRVDMRRSVDTEMERLREVAANVKDGAPGIPGEKGDSPEVDYDLIFRELRGDLSQMVAELPPLEPGPPGPPGKDGRDADEAAVVDAVLARIPIPKDGEPGKNADPEAIRALVQEEVAKVPPPRDGRDADPEQIVALVKTEVAAVIAELPPPEKGDPGEPGKDGRAADEAAVIEAVLARLPVPKDGEPGKDGREGKDAADIAGAFQTVDGKALLTLTDGRVLDLGIVKGADGAPGRDGANGKDGRDGKDGLSFDAFELEPEYDGLRTFRLKWLGSAGQQQTREWRLPVMIYREIWKPDVQYEAGDTVTFGGSLWVAKADTSEKPGDGGSAWKLAAKHGRDGRDGTPGAKGEKGDPGRPGRDLTRG